MGELLVDDWKLEVGAQSLGHSTLPRPSISSDLFEREYLRKTSICETNLFLQFSEELLVELPLGHPLPLPQLLKVVLQLLLLSILTSVRVLLVGNHVADVVSELCVNKHPVARDGSITEGGDNNPKASKQISFIFLQPPNIKM